MDIQEVLDRVDQMKPNNFSSDDKLRWLNELEGSIQTELYLRHPSEIVKHDSYYDELLLNYPFDHIYEYYLLAMIDFANGEYDKYNATYEMFNAKWNDLCVWYTTHYPNRGSRIFGNVGDEI